MPLIMILFLSLEIEKFVQVTALMRGFDPSRTGGRACTPSHDFVCAVTSRGRMGSLVCAMFASEQGHGTFTTNLGLGAGVVRRGGLFDAGGA